MNTAHTITIPLADKQPVSGFARWLSGMAERRARHRAYRTTLAELRSLSSRELADLGMNPTMLKRVAWQAAYESRVR